MGGKSFGHHLCGGQHHGNYSHGHDQGARVDRRFCCCRQHRDRALAAVLDLIQSFINAPYPLGEALSLPSRHPHFGHLD